MGWVFDVVGSLSVAANCLSYSLMLCGNTLESVRMQTEAGSFHLTCKYCIENPKPAVKTCLKCETSFCSQHLKPHLLKEAYRDHTLIEPGVKVTERHCPDHLKLLQHYCKEDAECVCVSCTIIGKHKSHTLLSLDQAQAAITDELEKEIKKLQGVQQNCSTKQRTLERSEAEIKTRINDWKGKSTQSFSEWRRKLDEDEESTMRVIDEEGLQALSQIRSCSEALNSKMEQIALIDGEIQSLLQRDPLSLIQNSKQLLSRVTEIQKVPERAVPVFTLNLTDISEHLQKKLNGWEKYHSDILAVIRKSPLSLDAKTANCYLVLSDDGRSVTLAEQQQPYPSHPERFEDYYQVLSSQSFSSGSHSWEGESDGKEWGMGIVYGSIDRVGQYSWFGESSNSWCLYLGSDAVTIWHDNERTDLPMIPSTSRIQVQLDYEVGTLSFYQVTDSLKHLHTIQTTFTEPVFPAFCCYDKSLKLVN
ncbi:E3 ubiquitin-protein ligase TRIM39-like [Chiloscyllium plagiosum]|uniref:E3 ubiquitin-protein ligase TRIM39-like n=1 Tax=Chiloscyllium plagiosum TaxID=36176 RepID=UPI001CB813EA|nr:E3 ubiquitin-protein ligase TRIM39-like [Chiloscyllium plagiosum]